MPEIDETETPGLYAVCGGLFVVEMDEHHESEGDVQMI